MDRKKKTIFIVCLLLLSNILSVNHIHAADEYTETVIIEKQWDDNNNSLNNRPNNLTLNINERPDTLDTTYAVSVWDIGVDKNQNNQTMGLTIGAALGPTDYVSTYKRHNASGTTSRGNAHRCFHDDSWEEIVWWNNTDPFVYEQCITQGCTHKLYINFPNGLVNNNYSYPGDPNKGDGVTTFRAEIVSFTGNNWLAGNFQHLMWNPLNRSNGIGSESGENVGSTNGGWGASRTRAVLNGADNLTEKATDYASGLPGSGTPINVANYTESFSILGGFPQVLKDAIGKKANVYWVREGNQLKTSYDKLWLPSLAEISNGYNSTSAGNYDIFPTDEGTLYKKFQNKKLTQNPYFQTGNSSGAGEGNGNNTYTNRALEYSSETSGTPFDWHLRTISKNNAGKYANVFSDGSLGNDIGKKFNGLSPAFTLDSKVMRGLTNNDPYPTNKLLNSYINGNANDAQWVKSGNTWTKTLTNVKVYSDYTYIINETAVPSGYTNTQTQTLNGKTIQNACKLEKISAHTWKCTLKNTYDVTGYAQTRFIDRSDNNKVLKLRPVVSGKAFTKITDNGYNTDLTTYLNQGYTLVTDGFASNPTFGNDPQNKPKFVDIILENKGTAKVQYIDKSNNNTVLSEKGPFEGTTQETILDKYVDKATDLSSYTSNGYRVVTDELSNDPKFIAGQEKIYKIVLEQIGWAKVEIIDKDQNNIVLEENGLFEGTIDEKVKAKYSEYNSDLQYYIDRGYKVVSDEIDEVNPSFKHNETKTYKIILQHTYTTVDKNTYEAGKCLNTACVTVQPEKGC